jgi:DHA1 family tetracycline resistance protein-like MFS transporter
MAVAGLSVLVYGGILMKPMIKRLGEKRLLITSLILFVITFVFYPFLYEFWMIFVFVLPFSFCMAFIRPLITSNMTKAVGLHKQGDLSGWSTNFQTVSQIFAPLIATSFLDVGALSIGLIYLDSYFLIGITCVLFALILFIIGYTDIKKNPRLYYYEKLRKKREVMKKKRLKEKEQN